MSSSSLLNALDLCHRGRGNLGTAWPQERERLLAVAPLRRKFAAPPPISLLCPNCEYGSLENKSDYRSRPTYLGRNRFVCHKVTETVLEECVSCGDRVPADDFGEHAKGCPGGKKKSLPQRPDRRLAALDVEERRSAEELMQFWHKTLRYREPWEHCHLLFEVLDVLALDGTSLRKLRLVASPQLVVEYPPPHSRVLKNCRGYTRGRQMQDSYANLLVWLRSLVRSAMNQGLLSKREGDSRDGRLAHLLTETKGEVIVQFPDGRYGARGPTLEGILFRYYGSTHRNRLLDLLAEGREPQGRSLKLPDGTELSCPVIVRNILGMEAFLVEGTTASAVTRCSLADFERRGRKEIDDSEAAGASYRWASGPSGKEILQGSERLVRAIEGYVKWYRPALAGGSQRGALLFPLQGGGSLKSLTALFAIFFKIAGGKPSEVLVTPKNVEAVRDSLIGKAVG
jgi:hypothetical protein